MLAAPLFATVGRADVPEANAKRPAGEKPEDAAIPFFGKHQAGIATPPQSHVVFASFDATAENQSVLVGLLRDWTEAAARLTVGNLAAQPGAAPSAPQSDSGDVLGLGPGRLTLTFGFGPGLFEKNGKDRYGLAAKRPAALVDLPRFNGDQLEPAYVGGDLCVQACADDSAIAFHAIRQLARMASPDDAASGYGGKKAGATAVYDAKPGAATLRWLQAGFLPGYPSADTPRNLFGFKDGTQNPGRPFPAERTNGKTIDNGSLEDAVWVGEEGPDWMRGGSYLVVRRIRMALQHWDNTALSFQEQVFGRKKTTGAPLSGGDEFEPLDLSAADKDGNPLIPDNAHVRLGSAAANDGARILRRAYSYNDGLKMIAERWPPWRQGLEYDAGLIFIAFQRDARTGFIKIFDKMSKFDMLNQFTTHVGSGIFACPSGVGRGELIGTSLFA
jgi:deferrochelatase/peroxidase EfeB